MPMSPDQAAGDGVDPARSHSWRARTAIEPTARRARAGAEAPADSGPDSQSPRRGPQPASESPVPEGAKEGQGHPWCVTEARIYPQILRTRPNLLMVYSSP